MIKVGVTGGIGSGKSMVCKLFSLLGVPIYAADEKARFLMEHDAALVSALKGLFGEEVYLQQKLNRVYLAQQVFHDASKLSQLNALVHPCVAKDFDLWVEHHAQAPLLIKEAAVMLENKPYDHLDKVIAVVAPEALRIQRVLKRDPQRTEKEVKAIIDKQFPENKNRALADFIIINDDKHLVIPQVMQLYQTLYHLANTPA